MGGDGGSLNNSRAEYTRLRQTVCCKRNVSTDEAQNRQRASTTHCSLTKAELQPPHVVGDRLGQLYNKEALLRHMIFRAERSRAGHRNGDGDKESILAHIRSVKKDTVPVTLCTVDDSGVFVCPVTRRTITPDGRFSFGWTCGCVAADRVPMEKGISRGAESSCLVCGVYGERIPLGTTMDCRQALRKDIMQKRGNLNKEGSRKKRKLREAELFFDVKEGLSRPHKTVRANEHQADTDKCDVLTSSGRCDSS